MVPDEDVVADIAVVIADIEVVVAGVAEVLDGRVRCQTTKPAATNSAAARAAAGRIQRDRRAGLDAGPAGDADCIAGCCNSGWARGGGCETAAGYGYDGGRRGGWDVAGGWNGVVGGCHGVVGAARVSGVVIASRAARANSTVVG